MRLCPRPGNREPACLPSLGDSPVLKTVSDVPQNPPVEFQGDQPSQCAQDPGVSWAVGFSVLKLGMSWQTGTSGSLHWGLLPVRSGRGGAAVSGLHSPAAEQPFVLSKSSPTGKREAPKYLKWRKRNAGN